MLDPHGLTAHALRREVKSATIRALADWFAVEGWPHQTWTREAIVKQLRELDEHWIPPVTAVGARDD